MQNPSDIMISVQDVKRSTSSYVDPHGFVFHYKNALFRCIRSNAKAVFRELIDDGTIESLRAKGLVSTKVSNLRLIEEQNGLVVEHEKIWPLSYCVEWCPSMLCDAGRLTLNLALELNRREFTLQDAHPWNILFSGSKPLFVDLTSIVPVNESVLWQAHEQFEAYFRRPLALAQEGKGFVARQLMFDHINGITRDAFHNMISVTYRSIHPGLGLSVWLDSKLQRSKMNKMRIRKVSERIVRQATPETRKRFLESLLHLLNKSPKRSTKDSWSEYYTMSRRSQNATKLNIVAKLLDRMKPQTVLDVGSNTGLFSVEAARRGARVISLDRSESCIEGLYATARRENLTITPLIADVVCPTPAFGHLGIQFPSLWKRVRSSLVLFLGIMHHVHVTGRQSFDRIIELLSAVSEDHLIFEFVGRNDAEMPHLPRSRTIDYTRDSVVGELESRFRVLKAIASDRPTRELLVCEKR